MTIWTILKNLGLIIPLFKSLSSIIGYVAQQKKMPPQEQIKAALDAVEALLDSGAIDIPGVDEKSISEALKLIESQLVSENKA